jgi:hypothetical protein
MHDPVGISQDGIGAVPGVDEDPVELPPRLGGRPFEYFRRSPLEDHASVCDLRPGCRRDLRLGIDEDQSASGLRRVHGLGDDQRSAAEENPDFQVAPRPQAVDQTEQEQPLATRQPGRCGANLFQQGEVDVGAVLMVADVVHLDSAGR